ncbi:hypothetical protein GYMLUDRAFT_106348, partial [Collybiopsis luxurians FD-317 M1]
CVEGTRVQILAEIEQWALGTDSLPGYWICGMAGTGKSTIAKSMCLILEAQNNLAGSFFCTRQIPECRDYRFIIPTLAYQLAHFSTNFNIRLRRLLNQDPDIVTKSPIVQVCKLLIEPWLACIEAREMASPVIVLDALDEC